MTALKRDKIWAILGTEFGDDASKSAIIVTALYSPKSVGASFGHSLHNIHGNWGISLVMLALTCG